jgi:hypothetical protein
LPLRAGRRARALREDEAHTIKAFARQIRIFQPLIMKIMLTLIKSNVLKSKGIAFSSLCLLEFVSADERFAAGRQIRTDS